MTGIATASSGTTYGVHGRSYSTSGRAVFGNASAASGFTYGVSGQSWSSTGRGVSGLALARSGVNYGVWGETVSPDGFAGYFVGSKSYFQGRIGIGKPDPQAKLHIGGMAGVDGLMFPDGTLQTTAATAGGDSLWSESGSDIFYDPGYVGIGTSSPVSRLHIVGPDDPATGALLTLAADSGDRRESGRIRFGESTGNLRGAFIRYDGLMNKLHLGTHQVANSDPADDVNAITISRVNGAVGIGMDSPAWPLHVTGDTFFEDRVGVGGLSTGAQLHVEGDAHVEGDGYFSGDVGIGTQDPLHKLHVAGSARIDGPANIVRSGTSKGIDIGGTGTGAFIDASAADGTKFVVNADASIESSAQTWVTVPWPAAHISTSLDSNFEHDSEGCCQGLHYLAFEPISGSGQTAEHRNTVYFPVTLPAVLYGKPVEVTAVQVLVKFRQTLIWEGRAISRGFDGFVVASGGAATSSNPAEFAYYNMPIVSPPAMLNEHSMLVIEIEYGWESGLPTSGCPGCVEIGFIGARVLLRHR